MLKTEAVYIFAVAIAFIVFQFFILLNSFPALNEIYTIASPRIVTGSFWSLVWFSSELVGEIGLILRVAGACLFLVFAWILLQKKEFSFAVLRKAVLLEGVYYLFYVPFMTYLFTMPTRSSGDQMRNYETVISYTIQTILIFSTFMLLYVKTRNPNVKNTQLFKWSAIAIISFVFALWVKHFIFNFYALPIDSANPILMLGLLNSTFTMLAASLILLFTFLPIIRGKTEGFSSRQVGIAFVLVSVYFIIYILVALVNSGYMDFLTLTELWAIALGILGAGFLIKRETKLNVTDS